MVGFQLFIDMVPLGVFICRRALSSSKAAFLLLMSHEGKPPCSRAFSMRETLLGWRGVAFHLRSHILGSPLGQNLAPAVTTTTGLWDPCCCVGSARQRPLRNPPRARFHSAPPAADYPKERFRDSNFKALRAVCSCITLYADANDGALIWSQRGNRSGAPVTHPPVCIHCRTVPLPLPFPAWAGG